MLGAALRVVVLTLVWNRPLDPDASEYLLLARRYSFAHPWSASFREPLWRAIVKLVAAPFGYDPHALRVFTTAVSIATLPIAWLLLRRIVVARRAPAFAAVIALAVVCLSAQLVRESSRGLREDLCLLLFLVVGTAVLGGLGGRRGMLGAAAAVGVLSVIRWELAVFALALLIVAAVARRLPPATPIVAAAALVVLSGPWLLANQQRHHRLFYNTAVHATYYWKQDQTAAVRRRFYTPPAVDPPIHLTWGDYYLRYLGPARSVERFAVGYPKLAVKFAASQVVPRGAAVSLLGTRQHGVGWDAALLLVGAIVAAAAIAAVRLLRRAAWPRLLLESLLLTAAAIVPYAVLARVVETRVLVFAVPFLALSVGVATATAVAARAEPRAEPEPEPVSAH